MKKNVLALSIAALIGGVGFTGAASAGVSISESTGVTSTALEVSANGVGHILLVPYFSTQNGNVSLLNITNTDTKNGKAVKLRYRGASNSDDIYDITIYLSPGDMWSANVSQVNGVSTLVTNDNSCTLPASVNAPFSTERVLNKDPAQTLEGYIEILNMADVPPTLASNAAGTLGTTENPLFKATKHVNGKAPCGDIADQKQDLQAYDTTDPNSWNVRGYNYPSGGLMANWSIINLSKAGSFTGEATAIAATSTAGVPGTGRIVFSPQEEDETITQTHAEALTADPLLRGLTPVVAPKNYDFPDLSTPYVNGTTNPSLQAEMLSDALATNSITNEYMTSPDVGFATDWTFSMPSRRYAVAMNYNGTGTIVQGGSTKYFDSTIPGGNVTKSGYQICVKAKAADLAYYNTEEGTKAPGGYVISPQPAGLGVSFCGETSVLAFNLAGFGATTPTGVLGAMIARQNLRTMKNTTDFYTDGWMSLQTPGKGDGLPVIGHAFVKALGTSASLGGIWKHRTDLVNP